MSIKTLEAKVEAYAKTVGKDVEQVYDELKAFIDGKHSEVTTPKIVTNTATGLGSVPAGQIAANGAGSPNVASSASISQPGTTT